MSVFIVVSRARLEEQYLLYCNVGDFFFPQRKNILTLMLNGRILMHISVIN